MRVLLTDNDDNSLLVDCPSVLEADEVGQAAVWSDGGVSAWLVDGAMEIPYSPEVVEQLRAGARISALEW